MIVHLPISTFELCNFFRLRAGHWQATFCRRTTSLPSLLTINDDRWTQLTWCPRFWMRPSQVKGQDRIVKFLGKVYRLFDLRFIQGRISKAHTRFIHFRIIWSDTLLEKILNDFMPSRAVSLLCQKCVLENAVFQLKIVFTSWLRTLRKGNTIGNLRPFFLKFDTKCFFLYKLIFTFETWFNKIWQIADCLTEIIFITCGCHKQDCSVFSMQIYL